MNPFNAITFAAFCGALASPATMALEFITQPAPIIAGSIHSKPSMEDFSASLEAGKLSLSRLSDAVNDYYHTLIMSDDDSARKFLIENGLETIELCEMFLRAFEEEVKKSISREIPDFVKTELNAYWRYVAKARSVVTRLNDYAKSLFRNAVVFEGRANLDGISELASHTTNKIKSMSFH